MKKLTPYQKQKARDERWAENRKKLYAFRALTVKTLCEIREEEKLQGIGKLLR